MQKIRKGDVFRLINPESILIENSITIYIVGCKLPNNSYKDGYTKYIGALKGKTIFVGNNISISGKHLYNKHKKLGNIYDNSLSIQFRLTNAQMIKRFKHYYRNK